jgi:hypothetical protein
MLRSPVILLGWFSPGTKSAFRGNRKLSSAILVCAVLLSTASFGSDKKQLPIVRWTAGAPGCTFERTDDGHFRWTMTGSDLSVNIMLDSQELKKHRFYRLLGMYVAVIYSGKDKIEFPADLRLDFIRHHDVLEGYEDPVQLSNTLQNDIDTKVFQTERKIKKDPKTTEEKTALLREYEKDAAQFIEFLSTQGLDPNTVMLTPGNPEAHGWVFFATKNKWIGPWKDREDFMLSVWMKDKIWQFPISLPPGEGDVTLRKQSD